MKIKSEINPVFLTGILMILLINCKKEDIKVVPTITIGSITNITANSATCSSEISSNGGTEVVMCGFCWSSTNQKPTLTDNKTSEAIGSNHFTSSITGLTQGITYYLRAYASNSIGTAYSNRVTLTTLVSAPTITTTELSAVTFTSANSGGNISSDGGTQVTAKGVCWSNNPNPTITNNKTSDGIGLGAFSSCLFDLASNTTFYLRAYATNSKGTSYGSEVSFKTAFLNSGEYADIDGNIYHTVTIGTQVWMLENLKTTSYNDGTKIPNVTSILSWSGLQSPGYCIYDNNETNKNIYGALYNGYTIVTGKLAPTGWHVPTDVEWTNLINAIGGYGSPILVGFKLKETGRAHWLYNDPATNESGFTALPGGFRNAGGLFGSLGQQSNWWSSTLFMDPRMLWCYQISAYSLLYRNVESRQIGLSVRCIKD